MTDWPTALKPINGTLRETPAPNFVNDPADVGSARRRARYTRTLQRFDFQLRLSNTNAAALRTFLYTTTGGGVSAFNWTHPVTSTVYEVRFASLPDIEQVTLGAWGASVSLEEV